MDCILEFQVPSVTYMALLIRGTFAVVMQRDNVHKLKPVITSTALTCGVMADHGLIQTELPLQMTHKPASSFVHCGCCAGTNYKVMKKAFDEGWGGVICKTLSLDSSKVSTLHFTKLLRTC